MTTVMIELEDASNIQKLLGFVKRLKGQNKVQIKDAEMDDDDGVPQRVADNIVSGLELIKKSERGEIKLQNAYDLLKELREEAVMV